MPKTIKITKGLDIKLAGEAEKTLTEIKPESFALKPTDFIGVFPRMLVKEGDEVKAGTPLFIDKYRENIVFTALHSGKVLEIKRGDKRALLEVRLQTSASNDQIDFGPANPASLSRENIKQKLLISGLWPMIKQRPYGIIANPDHAPKAIFISAFDSAPLAPDYDFIVKGKGIDFQTGLDVLKGLTDGKVYLSIGTNTQAPEFLNAKNVELNIFKGPHPSGNVGVHINHLDAINKGEIVWVVKMQDVITIGYLFNKGVISPEIIVALAGSEVLRPRYFKTIRGGCIKKMVESNVNTTDPRYISGNVLTGTQIRPDNYLHFYDSMVTVIPEGNYSEFLGWALPGFNKFSTSRSYPSFLTPKKKYVLDTNLHGGQRAYVMTGKFEKVFPMDILPLQLIKAIIYEDIDLMESLGIYEVEPEDFALVEFVDTSKTNIQSLVRRGLEIMRKEMN
ncbi:MAG TPA: Na(+)-translocating NADH-quinone reductase subunit A [Lentimicrobium sp.]|nr:Na(+)-translocating NADH-quinone reductase subunit A [Lentimicrobium sp.]